VIGIVLMQTSALEVFQEPGQPNNLRRDLVWGLVTSTAYTALVFLLVKVGWIHTPIPALTIDA